MKALSALLIVVLLVCIVIRWDVCAAFFAGLAINLHFEDDHRWPSDIKKT